MLAKNKISLYGLITGFLILLSSFTKGNDYGNVELGSNHRILSFKEKSGDSIAQFINAGVYCLNKDLIKRQQEGNASIEQDWLPEWLNKENIMGMVLKKPFTYIHMMIIIRLLPDGKDFVGFCRPLMYICS